MTRTDAAPLDARETAVLAAVCDAFFPRLTPGPHDVPELFQVSADDVGLPAAVAQAMWALSVRQRRELRLFLRLLDSRWFMLLATRSKRFVDLAADEREAVLLALATHAVPPLRTGFQALKRLSTFLSFSITTEQGANPTWPSIQYALPRPASGTAALTLTALDGELLDADVCVVGSGAGGGVVAARLAAAGRSVVVLEAGPADQAPDFDQREIVGMQRLYLDRGTTTTTDLGVVILAGSAIGGGTTVNWQTSLRLPEFVRDEWTERSGIRAFTESSFTQALDAVCGRLSVGTNESVRNGNNTPLERGCTALGYRWSVIPRNARGCDQAQCGYCVFGCRVGGKQSTTVTYLADAQTTGQTRIVANARATRVRVDRGRAAGVDAIVSGESGDRPLRVRATTVVVAAGALETPALLLRSGIEHPQLGRNLFLHPTSGAIGVYDEDVRGWIGAPQTVLCDEFARVRGNYGFRFETAPIHPGLLALALPWHGAREFRERMQHAPNMSGFISLTRDSNAGTVRVDADGRPRIRYRLGRPERELIREGVAQASRIHWAAGAREIHTIHTVPHSLRRATSARDEDIERFALDVASAPVHGNRCGIFSAHQMGTCRMGTDPRQSVCDERGQVRGIEGLHVADASLFPASSGVNPMITIMALAHLVADHIANV